MLPFGSHYMYAPRCFGALVLWCLNRSLVGFYLFFFRTLSQSGEFLRGEKLAVYLGGNLCTLGEAPGIFDPYTP